MQASNSTVKCMATYKTTVKKKNKIQQKLNRKVPKPMTAPPPFASWKDPGIKIAAAVKFLRFTTPKPRKQIASWVAVTNMKKHGYSPEN